MQQRVYVFVDGKVPLILNNGEVYEAYSLMFGTVLQLPANVSLDSANGYAVMMIETLNDYENRGSYTTFVTSKSVAAEQGRLDVYNRIVDIFNKDYNKTYSMRDIELANQAYDDMVEAKKSKTSE